MSSSRARRLQTTADRQCRGSIRRFELLGTNSELVLMNDHQLICKRLHATGDFVLYSGRADLLTGGDG